MFNSEATQKEIEAARKQEKPWVEARMDRLSALDANTRVVGQLFLGYDEKGKPASGDKQWRSWQRGVARMRRLSDSEMLLPGEAFYLRAPDVFRATWNLQETLPYQSGYTRRPFRAPGRPDLLRDARATFLTGSLMALDRLDVDMPWLAAHAPHLMTCQGGDMLGLMLAGAIELGGARGEEVEQILRDSAAGLHEIGQMGRHVTTAFLCCRKPDCWEFIVKLLLAAQRQEGLRQAILESIDFAQPAAFRRMLRLIDDENLVRFSATVRVLDVWTGFQFDSAATKAASDMIRSIAVFLDDDNARAEAIAGDDPETAFLALWSSAFDDAPATIPEASKLLQHPKAENRFIGVHMLGMLDIPDTYEHFQRAVDDADARVAIYAASLAINQRQTAAWREQSAQETLDDTSPSPDVEDFGYLASAPILENTGDLFDHLILLR